MSKHSTVRKKARPGVSVRLLKPCPATSAKPDPLRGNRSPLPGGGVAMVVGVKEARRTKGDRLDVSGWGTASVLELNWSCECCGTTLSGFIPQSWLREGKAVRVPPDSRTSFGATTFGSGYCQGVLDVLAYLLEQDLNPRLARDALRKAAPWPEFERACSDRTLERFRPILGAEGRPAASPSAGGDRRNGKTGKRRKT